ncbi:MAG: Na(+)/H(+) antiporter subunit B [Thermodesulfobacteriota bacterium]|nr:Na(+)/H(+) antiporter subunit B [Thermodesulfobacteriota bacterium]
MKPGGLILVVILGSVLIYGSLEFPPWGDPASPANSHVSPYYIEKSVEDTSVPNLVTAVLADYRGYDTMFETIVIFTAGIACIFLLRIFRKEETETRLYRHIPTGITLRIEKSGKFPEKSAAFERIDSVWVPHDLIVKTTCRLIVPFIQIFGLYVIAHGHHSPGGGFQGGVILGAAMILFAVAFNLRSAIRRMSERLTVMLSALGVFIYAGTGALCVLLGLNYLDYSALAGVIGVDPVTARSHGILIVEIGVGIAVMAVMVTLYYNLASAGKHDEGL